MVDRTLFVDSCSSFLEMDLHEATSERGLMKFRGKFQEAGAVNKNKRIYPFEVLDESVRRLQEAIKTRQLLGELDHPTDSIIHFANASHVVTRLWWEGNLLMGEGEILNTPYGKLLKTLINDGIRVGISSRGIGNGRTNENGILVIGESYKLITFDAVADPSTYDAFQEKVVAAAAVSQRETFMQPNTPVIRKNEQISSNSSLKNESISIDKVNKNALIAWANGVVKSASQNIKRG